MIDRYHYGVGENASYDKIRYRKETPVSDLRYNIGDRFKSYDFTQPAMDFEEAVCERLLQLKKSNRYLRLWFSGGKDSLIVLKTAKKLNIKIDEIIVVKNWILGPHINIGSITEITDNAVYWVEQHRSELNGTKITYIDYTDAEYELVFKDPSWANLTNIWFLHIGWAPSMFYRFVEPVQQFLEPIEDRYDILGSTHPHIWWDDGWHFTYIDMQFQQHCYSTIEDFLSTPDFPELAHSYAKTVSRELDKLNIKLGKFQPLIAEKTNQRLRNVRDLVPSYQFPIRETHSMFPKVWQDPWRPTDDLFWKANMTYKTTLSAMILFYENPRKKFFTDYLTKVDWNQINEEIEFGGILTKEFDL